MTTTHFIDRVLRDLPLYTTCIPSNHISSITSEIKAGKLKPPFYFIVNTAPAHIEIGGHWMLVYCKRAEVEVFDSLALSRDLLPTDIIHFLNFYKKVVYSNTPIQSPSSIYCGLFAIARALSISNGQTLETFLSHFLTRDLDQNDLLVEDYIVRTLNEVY